MQRVYSTSKRVITDNVHNCDMCVARVDFFVKRGSSIYCIIPNITGCTCGCTYGCTGVDLQSRRESMSELVPSLHQLMKLNRLKEG